MSDLATWLAIAACVSQSAALSGLNLALFSLSRLRLEVAADTGDPAAVRVLALRRDANRTLVTILWGNVAVNVLLTLLADSVMVGVAAFLFSTIVITFAGEIIPQAYFTRHALAVAGRLAPLLRLYRVLLYPLAKPVGLLLDRVVGPETIPWFGERELRAVLRHHARAGHTEVGQLEATGAINFLALDDLPVDREGEPLDPDSVIELPFDDGAPRFPAIARSATDPFLRRLAAPGKKWVVLTDDSGQPRLVLNAHEFLRGALFEPEAFDPRERCHRPLVVRAPARPLGEVLGRLIVRPEHAGDDVIDEDLILVWSETDRRIITGSDLLGRLLRGIARQTPAPAAPGP